MRFMERYSEENGLTFTKANAVSRRSKLKILITK